MEHRPVLVDAVLERLAIAPGMRIFDGTVGFGGHAGAMLEASSPDGTLVGLDRDPMALAASAQRLAPYGDRVELRRGAFGDVEDQCGDRAPFDAMLFDIGVSSPQLDRGERGFSFEQDGPVDMRMDPDQPLDAAGLLDELDEGGLARILKEYGEEPRARRIARAVLAGRPWTSTRALAACIAKASGYRGSRTHPATRTFQALRIAVNDELGQLDRLLTQAPELLAAGGRLGIITFHSLEDRRVKRAFRALAGEGGEKDAFGNLVQTPCFALVGRRGVAGAEVDPSNPRARSARLRVLKREEGADAS